MRNKTAARPNKSATGLPLSFPLSFSLSHSPPTPQLRRNAEVVAVNVGDGIHPAAERPGAGFAGEVCGAPKAKGPSDAWYRWRDGNVPVLGAGQAGTPLSHEA